MGDQWEKIDPDDSISETPSAETGGPPEWTGIRLRQFSRWLKRWATYVQARADLAFGQIQAGNESDFQPAAKGESPPPTRPPSGAGTPAHWHTSSTQGPPAHWLALFKDQQPGGDCTSALEGEGSQAFEGDLPQDATETPDKWILRFQAELGNFLVLPDLESYSLESLNPTQRSTGSLNVDSQGIEGSSEVAAGNLHPVEPGPARWEPVTPLEYKPSIHWEGKETERTISAQQPYYSSAEAQSTSAGFREFEAHLIPNTPDSSVEDQSETVSPIGEPDQTTTRQPQVSQALSSTPSAPEPGLTEERVTRFQLRSTFSKGSPVNHPAPDSTSIFQAPSENMQSMYRITKMHLKGTPPTSPREAPHPAPDGTPGQSSTPRKVEPEPPPDAPSQPDGIYPPPGVDKSRTKEPAWPEPPRYTKPAPIRWPTTSTHSPWPELPEPSPMRNIDTRPCQDPARRRRIDREQGGR